MNGWQKPGRTPLHVTVLCGLPHTCSFTRDRKRDCLPVLLEMGQTETQGRA